MGIGLHFACGLTAYKAVERRALELMEESSELGLADSDPTLVNSAISALAAGRQAVLAQELLWDMPCMQLRVDEISIGSLAKAHERGSGWATALRTLQEGSQMGVPRSGIALSSVTSSCRLQGRWPWTLQVLEALKGA